jgi:type VI secretion system protein ImpB
VPNKLADDDSQLNVELKFNNMDDFDPVNVLNQVEALKKLFEARQRLSDLIGKLDGNDVLDSMLQDIAADSGSLNDIKSLAGAAEGEGGEGGGE